MNIGSLLSGAGRVSTGVREREEELRRARLQQLVVEDANRRAANTRRQTTIPIPEVGTFGSDRQPQGVGVRPAPSAAPPQPQRPGVAVPPAQNPTTTAGKPTPPAPVVAQPEMTQQQFLAMSPEQRARYLQTVNDKRRLNQGISGVYYGLSPIYDVGAAPINAAAWAVEKGANAVGWPRLGAALGIYPPGTQEVTVPRIGDGSLAPMAGAELRNIEANRPLTEQEYLDTLPYGAEGNTRRGGPARRKNKAGGVEAPAPTTSSNVPANIAQYDKPTKYDGLIEQSAAAHGLDPVVFKRLLGTESSFNPTAVSPRGKSFGLGIGQIADSWGLSDAERLDPTIAIPKAAEILAGYVNKAGGDYREGMMKYKGASSEKGRASMAPIIDGILAGVGIGTAQADEVPRLAAEGPALREAIAAGGARPMGAQRAPAQAPTYDPEFSGGQTRSPAQFYLGNPQALGQDIRTAMMQREELVRMARLYQQDGMGAEYTQLRQQIMALDSQMAGLAGIQAVQQMEYSGNPLALSKMLSYFQDQQIDLKPYTDGSFDILIDGVVAHKNVPGWKVKDDALSLFDPQYRALKAEQAKEAHKGAVADRSEVVKQTAKMIADLRLEQFKGDVQMAVEYLKKTTGWDIKPDTNSGLWAILPPGEATPMVWDPAGQTIKRDGVEMKITGAQPIAGLTVGKGK